MRTADDEQRIRRATVGRFLRDRRVAAGLTQMSVAKSLRYSTAQFVSNWERGVSLPPLDALPRLAGLFKASNREVIEAMMQYEERMLELHKKQLTQLFKSR